MSRTTIINCSEGDMIRIERHGGSGAITMEADRVVAMFDVFRWMFENEDWDFSLFDTVADGTGEKQFEATAGNVGAEASNPWDAIKQLALECRR